MEVAAAAAVLVCWAVGLWLRMESFDATSLDQAAIQYHVYAALMAQGEPWPAVGPPAAFFLRHGTVNPVLLTFFQPLCDDLACSARAAAFLRSGAIPGLYLLARALGAPALGVAAAAARAVWPTTVDLDRHFGGTYFLDVVLVLTLWTLAAGARASTRRLLAAAALLACLPLIHPMGLPAALGLGIALVLTARSRPPRERLAIVAAGTVPLLPYLGAEVMSGFGATRSILGMLFGAAEFQAPGEEGVGLGWTLRLILDESAPFVLALPAFVAFVGAALLAVALLVWPSARKRAGTVLPGCCAAAAALLLFLQAVQGGAGYGYAHHVMSAFILGFVMLALAWGRLAPTNKRLRTEALLGGVLAVLLVPSIPGFVSRSLELDHQWPDGMSSIGSAAAMAELVQANRSGGPLHLSLVHAPDAQPPPSVALSAVVLDLIHDGLQLQDLPQYPPGDDVEGWLIVVGHADGVSPPGSQIPFDDPHPRAHRMPVRVWRTKDYGQVKRWMEGLPEGFEVFGTEEYQDVLEYYYARPRWPGRDGSLPVHDSPYRSSEW